MRALRLIAAVVLVLAITLLAGANVAPVSLDYVVGRVQVPLAVALFGALLVGVLLGGAAMYTHHLRVRWRSRHAAAPARSAPEPVATPARPALPAGSEADGAP